MKLDTVEAVVAQDALPKYCEKLDERGETYVFIVDSCKPEGIVLELCRDGNSDGVKIQLSVDGTWKMISYLAVGESRNV